MANRALTLWVAGFAVALVGCAAPAPEPGPEQQPSESQPSPPQQARPRTQPPKPDPQVKALVGRLALERYKATIKGLTQFGDRRQGTERNRKALDWIEAELKS